MVKITCYDGVGVIGGNKILLEDDEKDTVLFLDFGLNFSESANYYQDFLKNRSGRGALDYLVTGLLPPLKGIYREEIEPQGLWEHPVLKNHLLLREINRIDGVVLSHAHMDHWGLIGYLKRDIPLYTSAISALLIKAYQDSSSSDVASEAILLSPKEMVDGLLRSRGRGVDYIARDLRICGQMLSNDAVDLLHESQKTTKSIPQINITSGDRIGHINLFSYPVDHSIFGASAFALETSSGWILYTGDFRLHGERGHISREFVRKAKKMKPEVLICEGTRAGSKKGASEAEVEAYSLEVVRKCPQMVFADFSMRNLERMFSFARIAQFSNRKLVITEKTAYMLYALSTQVPEAQNLLKSDYIYIYREPAVSRFKWQKKLPYYTGFSYIEPGVIHENQDDYLLCFGYYELNELPDIMPNPGSIYIYSTSEAHSEEQKTDIRRLLNWLDFFKVKIIPGIDPDTLEIHADDRKFHSSGHASGEEILEIIRIINPTILIPVHTENPEWFASELRNDDIEVILPERGIPIIIG
ncbi:MAG: exonuclease [Candidatus Eremiobacteraeota bacterium]|nr:exonuclease [Candidatus Eremiobacteraeota bacterium]